MFCLSLHEAYGDPLKRMESGVLATAQRLARNCPTLRLVTLYARGGRCYGQGAPVNGRLDRFSTTGPFIDTLNGEPLRFWLPSGIVKVMAELYAGYQDKMCSVPIEKGKYWGLGDVGEYAEKSLSA
jgi:hypothetical protein